MAKAAASTRTKAKEPERREIRCYLCGHRFHVSARAMSVPCPHCNKALKIEDVVVKSYLPVNDLQTCGHIKVSKTGRVVAKIIRSGSGIECEGVLEGTIESDGDILMGPKATWKGTTLCSRSLEVSDGAKLIGVVKVPWTRPEVAPKPKQEVIVEKSPAIRSSATRRRPERG